MPQMNVRMPPLNMRTFNYVLAIVSVIVGITLCIFAVAIDGLSTALGIILGVLLVINGVLRLWLLKKKSQDSKPPVSNEGD
jgi:uncharacterized membrane protein HdeD (DUF308 family)